MAPLSEPINLFLVMNEKFRVVQTEIRISWENTFWVEWVLDDKKLSHFIYFSRLNLAFKKVSFSNFLKLHRSLSGIPIWPQMALSFRMISPRDCGQNTKKIYLKLKFICFRGIFINLGHRKTRMIWKIIKIWYFWLTCQKA